MGGGGCRMEMLLPLWVRLLRKIKVRFILPGRSWESKGVNPGVGPGGQGGFLQSQGTCIEPAAKAGKATRHQVVKGLGWWAEKCEDH